MNFHAASGSPEDRWFGDTPLYPFSTVTGWLQMTTSTAIFFKGVP
jgi:hypothetical protein